MLKQRQSKVRNKCVLQLILVDKREEAVWFYFNELGEDLKTKKKGKEFFLKKYQLISFLIVFLPLQMDIFFWIIQIWRG